jgi:hypothetical protein
MPNSLRRRLCVLVRVLATCLGGVFFSVKVDAATIAARSVDLADVSAAIAAASTGDVVQVPAGSATWSTTLAITKGITLAGAGIGSTVVTSAVNNRFAALIRYAPATPATNAPFRVTGFTFDGNWGSMAIDLKNPTTTNNNRIRIDHNRFIRAIQYAIRWDGELWGLIDHNEFIDNYLCTQVLGRNWLTWETFPLAPGSANYPYIEDNTYTYTGAKTDLAFVVEAGQGGRYVFRRNTIDVQSTTVGGALELFDAHGNQDPVTSAYRPNGSRGTLGIEIYDNTITLRAKHRILNLRGGEARVFNNTVTQIGASTSDIDMTEYDGWSYHFLSTYPGYDPVQNAFFWNNKINGANIVPSVQNSTMDPIFIQENRDWFRPAFGPVGNRPGSCTVNSYYGSTDTKSLYRCTAPNVWTLVYAPYTYPHPLISGGATTPPPAPAAPMNVRIIR